MNAHDNNNTAPKGLRGWWADPPRSGMRRIIAPWEYRHLRGWAGLRLAAGVFTGILGAIVLSTVSDGWVIFGAYLLVAAAANIALAYWLLSIARSESART